MKLTNALQRLVFALSIPLALATAAAAQERTDRPERYARVQASDARIRNLADDRGIELARPAAGSLVGVYRELAGWLEVEVPGGLAVWVHGRYLKPTGEEQVHEVTRNAVNMRPQPKSEVTNFPLPQRLHAGDRVLVIELREPELALESTWARIWSPAGVRAWIRAAHTQPLDEGEDGSALWQQALAELARTPGRQAPPAPRAVEAAAPASTEVEAREALLAARSLMETQRAAEQPDFAAVRSALEAVLDLSSEGPIAIEARQELERLAFHEEALAVRQELERERQRLAEETRLRQQEVIESSRRKDPLGGVFLSRGVVVRRIAQDGVARYFLRFGKEMASEIQCSSGRYDLEAFAGYPVGVHGQTLSAPGEDGAPMRIEVQRLEVTGRR